MAACANISTQITSFPDGLANLATSGRLACRYEKQIGDSNNTQIKNWYFWREAQRTETRDEFSNQGEIWESNDAGKFFYTRLFYNEHAAVEFVQGDLAATGATAPSTQQLFSLIDPKTLGKELTLLDKGDMKGMAVEYYSGTVKNIPTEVAWLPSLQLPARINKKLVTGNITLTLADCGNESKFSVNPITKKEFDNFRRFDYTDLGDMEDDPMVQRIEQLIGDHHAQKP